MTTCFNNTAVQGCYASATGPVSAIVHYTYDNQGAPSVYITDIAGNPIQGATGLNTTPGECCKPSKHFEFLYYVGGGGLIELTPSQQPLAFPSYPTLVADFPSVASTADFYLHGIEHGATGVLGTDGLPLTNPTQPVPWSTAQTAVNLALVAAGLPANSVIVAVDGAGQPVMIFDTTFVTGSDIVWWAGTSAPDAYTNKLKADVLPNGAVYGLGGCRKVEVLKTLACDGTLTLSGFELDGTAITGFDPTNLRSDASACDQSAAANKIYLSENTATTSIVDIMASAGAKKLHSLTIKQVQGTGILTGDSGGGVTLQLGEVWSWSVVSQAQTESLDTATLTMDANGGIQRITAIYTI